MPAPVPPQRVVSGVAAQERAAATAGNTGLDLNPLDLLHGGTSSSSSSAPSGDSPGLTALGHLLADWIIRTGHSVYGFFVNNLLAALVAGVALYVVFSPDFIGRPRM